MHFFRWPAAIVLLFSTSIAISQPKTVEVADNIYMIQGAGGNVAVSIGERPFLIDDQLAPTVKKLIAAIKQLTDKPIQFVLNTHFHADHTGGNPALSKQGAIVVAHDNTRTRMGKESISALFGRKAPPSKPEAWPIVTFSEEMTFHLNDHDIYVRHVNNAHTDGDVIVHFRDANVIHAGDVFLQGTYPIIDYYGGGSLDGVIAGLELLITLSDDKTKIIPGHGNLSTIDDVRKSLALCKDLKKRLAAGRNSGKSLEQQLAEKPLADLEERWGSRFMPGKKAYKMLYEGELSRNN